MNLKGSIIHCLLSNRNRTFIKIWTLTFLIYSCENNVSQEKSTKPRNEEIINSKKSSKISSSSIPSEKIFEKESYSVGSFEFSSRDLSVVTFRNGDPIKRANSRDEWLNACRNNIPAYCDKVMPTGKTVIYYNWHCIKDKRGLAPEGWHIPTKPEFTNFINTIGYDNAGSEMKSTSGWNNSDDTKFCRNCRNKILYCKGCNDVPERHSGPCGKFSKNGNGTNSSNFNAEPNGYRYWGDVLLIGEVSHYWLMGEEPSTFVLSNGSNIAQFRYDLSEKGYTVRCFKDAEKLNNLENTSLNFKFENDQSGNQFKFIEIGNQTWMAENLNVDKFRNGDPIPQAKTDEEWIYACRMKEPAWCYYDNDPSNRVKYGKLYNSYVLSDRRGFAPLGWHIPSPDDWRKLITYLGGYSSIAGNRMKLNSGWGNQGNGTNSTGFSGLPSGARASNGVFYYGGEVGSWWSSPFNWNDGTNIFHLNTYREDAYIRQFLNDGYGFSVRCVKD